MLLVYERLGPWQWLRKVSSDFALEYIHAEEITLPGFQRVCQFTAFRLFGGGGSGDELLDHWPGKQGGTCCAVPDELLP